MTKKAGAASVREQFVRTIESQILSGERKIGDRLPSARELCKLLDVSLTTVNTGLGELAAKGFVEIVPRQGVFVADYLQRGTPDARLAEVAHHGGRLGAAEVRNFCEARMAIDPDIAEWVIQRATDAQLDELGELLDDYRRSADCAEASDRITRFFHRMYQLSGNSFLALIYHSTIPHQILMYTTFMEKNGLEHVTQNAEEIYRFLCARDVPAARQCLIDAMHLPLEGETAIVLRLPPTGESASNFPGAL